MAAHEDEFSLPFVIDDETEVIPDLAVVDRKVTRAEHPSIAHLIVEVADSSVRYDRVVKAPLSAPRHGAYGKHVKVSKGSLKVPGVDGVEVALRSLFS